MSCPEGERDGPEEPPAGPEGSPPTPEGSPPTPEVSVVVSTYNRAHRLERLLESLAGQTLAPERFEVIVIDNGSQPPVMPLLERLGRAGPVRLSALRHDRPRGPAVARNAGWRRAAGRLIAFTDDDCRASPGWLEAALDAHGDSPDAILQGPTRPDPRDRANVGLLSRTQHIEGPTPQFETCNIFYPRELLERLGGFTESFGIEPAGEDTDLAWRGLAAGATSAFVPGAAVYHAIERIGMSGRLRVAARWGAVTRIYREHPGTRVMLYRRVFWTVWHYLLLRSLLVLVLPLPRALRRAVLLRHLGHLRARALAEGARVRELPWAIPFLVLHDAVEMATLARGSARNRTLVL